MELTTILAGALSTALGKAAVGSAVAALSVGGLQAADVVDVPGFDDEPEAVEITDAPMPADEVVEQTPAAGPADPQADRADRSEDTTTEATETETEAEAETDGAEPSVNATFGQDVAADARDGGVDGQAIAAEARSGTRAEERAAQRGAPETAGERQDGAERQDGDVRQDSDVRQDGDVRQDSDVRQDAGTAQDDDQASQDEVAEEQAPEPGSQADEHRPESAGPAAAAANGRP